MANYETFSIRTTPELKARIFHLAKETGRNISWYVNKILEEQIENLENIYLKEKIQEEKKWKEIYNERI
ncbi:hypothetical protein [Treponema pedis]|uniref:hypothetical protein n=1 Tax=Treponema pedis TaxID=409322 RepID=UPI000400C01A|nr:hypothetical protein [Treponema pedis]